jgi:integrase
MCAIGQREPIAAPRGHVRLERQPTRPSSRYQAYPLLYADIRKQSDKFRDARRRPRSTLTRDLDPWRPAVPSELAAQAGVGRRFAPHQRRHAHAVELARKGVPLNIIQRQLGHVNLGTTSIYLQGIDTEEIIAAVNSRRAPMMPASAGLQP